MTQRIWPLVVLAGLFACDGGDSTDTTADTQPTDDTPTDSETDAETDPVASDPCLVDDPVLELGTGITAFQTLSKGDDLVMVHGPQGGWHMTVGVRLQNTTELVRLSFTIEHLASGIIISDVDRNLALNDWGGGVMSGCDGEAIDIYGYLDDSSYPLLSDWVKDEERDTPPELLCGEQVEITVTAQASTGEDLGSASVVVTAQADPDYPDTTEYCPG